MSNDLPGKVGGSGSGCGGRLLGEGFGGGFGTQATLGSQSHFKSPAFRVHLLR